MITIVKHWSDRLSHGRRDGLDQIEASVVLHLLLTTRFPAARSFNHSCPPRLASREELGSLVGSTADHLSSCCLIQHAKDLSMVREAKV